MKTIVLCLLIVVCILAAGCTQPTAEEATAAFCESLEGLTASLDSFQSTVGPTATVEDTQAAIEAVDKAWNQVVESAGELKDVRVDAIDEARKGLRQTIDSIDSDDTLAAARANIDAGLAQVKAAVAQVGSVACPGMGAAAPAGETAAETPAAESAPTVEAAAPVEPAPLGFTGTFSGAVVLAGTTATDMVLVLNEDNSAFLVMRPAGQTTETVVSGQWQDNADNTATVTLSTLMDGSTLATPEVLSFSLAGDQLVATQFDELVYGAEGFSLQRLAGAAIAGEAETLQASTEVTASAQLTATAPLTSTAELTASAPLFPIAPLTSTAEVTATAPLTTTAETDAQPAAPAASTPAASESSLVGAWQLQRIEQAAGVSYVPTDPALYTVAFQDDGTLAVTADCNTGTGTYQASASGSLSLQLAASRAYCGPQSLSSPFLSYLAVANSYSVQDGLLVIGFSNDSGRMSFSSAP